MYAAQIAEPQYPDWAVKLFDRAKITGEKSIPLKDLPSPYFEKVAFAAKNLVYEARFIAVTVDDLKKLFREGQLP